MSRCLPLLLLASLALGACDDDGGPAATGDGAGPTVDAAPSGPRATGGACRSGADCLGGTCLGVRGGPEPTNVRFAAGYCTTAGCVANSQEGCGPDEFCLAGGALGSYCVELCSKADGMSCDRADHACFGLGTWGGCFARTASECDAVTMIGCPPEDICVRVGFEDEALGRCEERCDPMAPSCSSTSAACYYVRSYNAAFCAGRGTPALEDVCSCDVCCGAGLACTPDPDGVGKHCKRVCTVANGVCSDGSPCVPLEDGSPYGGCVPAGSAGT